MLSEQLAVVCNSHKWSLLWCWRG